LLFATRATAGALHAGPRIGAHAARAALNAWRRPATGVEAGSFN
jgi:hypothetical protein